MGEFWKFYGVEPRMREQTSEIVSLKAILDGLFSLLPSTLLEITPCHICHHDVLLKCTKPDNQELIL